MNGEETERLWKTLDKFEASMTKYYDNNNQDHKDMLKKMDNLFVEQPKSYVRWRVFALVAGALFVLVCGAYGAYIM